MPVNFAYCWDPGELSPAADVNTYHIMHSSCNTIPLSLSVTYRWQEDHLDIYHAAGSSRDWKKQLYFSSQHTTESSNMNDD